MIRRKKLGKKKITRSRRDAATDMRIRPTGIKCVSTGCEVLDCVVGGGWPIGRIVNIAGDKSTGKTLLAIEACANFYKQYPQGFIRYAEGEAAFDVPYAQLLGLPTSHVQFASGIITVEDFYEDLVQTIKKNGNKFGIYILDSLDSLSTRAELKREIDASTYGADKARQMSELFRRITRKLNEANILVIVISQVRDNIGVTFGERHTRSGGKALDFYASQVLWLAERGKLERTIKAITRPIGINVRARCKKNKIALPYRECDFPILFGYGVDDVTANIEYIAKVRGFEAVGLTKTGYKRYVREAREKGGKEYEKWRMEIAKLTREIWYEVETGFLPSTRKY